MIESWSNILLVVLSVLVCYLGFFKLKHVTGTVKVLLTSAVWASAVIGVSELLDLLQVFPDGTFMADLLYEKEILVLILLLWGITSLRNGKE